MQQNILIPAYEPEFPNPRRRTRLPTHNVWNCSPDLGSVKFLTLTIASAIGDKSAVLEKNIAFQGFLQCSTGLI